MCKNASGEGRGVVGRRRARAQFLPFLGYRTIRQMTLQFLLFGRWSVSPQPLTLAVLAIFSGSRESGGGGSVLVPS